MSGVLHRLELIMLLSSKMLPLILGTIFFMVLLGTNIMLTFRKNNNLIVLSWSFLKSLLKTFYKKCFKLFFFHLYTTLLT